MGDKSTDLHFGKNIGIPEEHLVLVLTGHGQEHVGSVRSDKSLSGAFVVCENVQKAADIIVSR